MRCHGAYSGDCRILMGWQINGVAESKRLTAFIDNCWNHKQEWLNTVGILTVIARADAIFARFT